MVPAEVSTSAKQRKSSVKRPYDSQSTSLARSKSSGRSSNKAPQFTEDVIIRRAQFVNKTWIQGLLFKVDCLLGGPLLNTKEIAAVYLLVIALLALAALGSYKQLTKMAALLSSHK